MRRYVIALALLLTAAVATEAASRFIVCRFPGRPLADDLLLGLLPEMPVARHLTTGMIIAGFVIFALFAFREARADVPAIICIFAIMYLSRAALLVLTPLANANGGQPAAFPLFEYGMFPSGHAAAMLLLARSTDGIAAPRTRAAEIALTAGVCVGLLLARSHYTIDIAGGLLLAYFVEREWTTGRLFGPLRRLVA